jgi:hypothetical protein
MVKEDFFEIHLKRQLEEYNIEMAKIERRIHDLTLKKIRLLEKALAVQMQLEEKERK